MTNRNLHGIYALETIVPELEKMRLESLTVEETRKRIWDGEGFKTAQHWYLPLHGFRMSGGAGLYGSTDTCNDDDEHHTLALISNTVQSNLNPAQVNVTTLAITAYEPSIRQALGIEAK